MTIEYRLDDTARSTWLDELELGHGSHTNPDVAGVRGGPPQADVCPHESRAGIVKTRTAANTIASTAVGVAAIVVTALAVPHDPQPPVVTVAAPADVAVIGPPPTTSPTTTTTVDPVVFRAPMATAVPLVSATVTSRPASTTTSVELVERPGTTVFAEAPQLPAPDPAGDQS